MIFNNLISKKVFVTLLSVCFAVTVFANNGGGSFYVKKGTKVSGVEHVSVKNAEVKSAGFYVKQGTVVSGLSNVHTNIKVTQKAKIDAVKAKPNSTQKQVVTTKKQISKKQVVKHSSKTQYKPNSRIPFKGKYLGLNSVHVAVVVSNTTNYSNKITYSKTKKHIRTSNADLVFIKTPTISNTYSYTTKNYTSSTLSINYCRTPPIV